LVVTDRRVVDDRGAPIAASFWENQGIHPRNIRNPFDYFFHPVAAGSSMLMNQALLVLVQPIPNTAVMHDCWIELVAARFAKSRYIERALLLYVKHARNVSGGGRAYGARRYFKRALYLFSNLKRQRAVYRRMLNQARSFLAVYGEKLSEAERKQLRCLMAMEGAGIAKFWLAPRAAGLPPTWERKLAFVLLV
jgi:hypothetical protein